MRNKFKSIVLIVVSILIFSGSSISAQEWSGEQMEVWKHVETYWELYKNEDIKGFLSYIHPENLGWGYNNPLPMNKSSLEKWLKYYYENNSIDIIEINPVSISIFDDVAIVNYFWREVSSDTTGKKTGDKGRWTDILKKQDDKWIVISYHGGSTKK